MTANAARDEIKRDKLAKLTGDVLALQDALRVMKSYGYWSGARNITQSIARLEGRMLLIGERNG